jgi:hypothetical protein
MDKRYFLLSLSILTFLTFLTTVSGSCYFGECGIKVCKLWKAEDGKQSTLDQVYNISIGIVGGVTIDTWSSIPSNNRTCVYTFEGANLTISWWDHRGFQQEYKVAECEIVNTIPPKHSP